MHQFAVETRNGALDEFLLTTFSIAIGEAIQLRDVQG